MCLSFLRLICRTKTIITATEKPICGSRSAATKFCWWVLGLSLTLQNLFCECNETKPRCKLFSWHLKSASIQHSKAVCWGFLNKKLKKLFTYRPYDIFRFHHSPGVISTGRSFWSSNMLYRWSAHYASHHKPQHVTLLKNATELRNPTVLLTVGSKLASSKIVLSHKQLVTTGKIGGVTFQLVETWCQYCGQSHQRVPILS